jgi:uncharacterized protein (TIGR02444 family)
MLQGENDFWKFSLAVYQKPGVEDECLALQVRFNVDVNILLFCVWLGTERIALGEKEFAAIDAQVERWHQAVVRPLRAVRQSMKLLPEQSRQECSDLRKMVASAELRAEQLEEALLVESAGEIAHGSAESQDAIEENVLAFLRRHAGPLAEGELPRRLIAAARSQAGQ